MRVRHRRACAVGYYAHRSHRDLESVSIVTRHGTFVVVLMVAIAFDGGLNRAESGGGSGIKGRRGWRG